MLVQLELVGGFETICAETHSGFICRLQALIRIYHPYIHI